MGISAQERAERSADAMWANDKAFKWMGVTFDHVGPGTATLSMTVEDWHTNGHNMCHGGIIFTLADSAFAFACNSYNQMVVAQHNNISFIAPGEVGDKLTATANEISRQGRSGVYDVTVARHDGTVVAEFRGCSRTIKGVHFEEEASTE